jgi:phosphatidylglycerol lysyltransferase
VIYALLPPGQRQLSLLLGAFLMGQIDGLVSQVPGGLGVLRIPACSSCSPRITATALFATLVAYGVVYYLVPLVLAAALLAAREALAARKSLAARESALEIGAFLTQWFPVVVPRVLAVLAFLAGLVLLFSGATPSVHERLRWLEEFLPLGVLEASHFVGSLAAGTIILARAAQAARRRLLVTAGLLSQASSPVCSRAGTTRRPCS